jgi:hypothetical protein
MKCSVHPGCSSPAVKRYNITDDTFLRWLLSGEIPAPDATKAQKQALKAAHQAMFAKFVGKGGPAAAAASSSNGGPSSTAPV